VNFVTAHDGFTLADLFSYNDKHNERNGEGNADGENDNHGWNCGHEGPTDDPEVLALRARLARNALTLLLLARGVPMLAAGDEFGRTQQGNNNAYCHDGELSWVDWGLADTNKDLLEFTRGLIAFRRAHPALRSATFDGVPGHDPDPRPDGRVVTMTFEAPGDAVFLAANAHWEPAEVAVAAPPEGMEWRTAVDTFGDLEAPADQNRITVGPRSALVLAAVPRGETRE
jgi:glycogen operon protein